MNRYPNITHICIMLYAILAVSSSAQAAGKVCSDNTGKVARAMVTTAIENREPVNRVLILENKTDSLYFFSDLRHMQGQQVFHQWEYEGKVVMRKGFKVQGPRWRIYSRKDLQPDMTGHWTVVVTDGNNCPLKAVVFQYVNQDTDGQSSAIIDLKK